MPGLFAAPFVAAALLIALSAPQPAAAGEHMAELARAGYRVIHTDPFLAIEGCERSKRVLVDAYTFICQTNEYVFHYGKAEVLGQTPVKPGQPLWPAYICVDEDRCLRGELTAR